MALFHEKSWREEAEDRLARRVDELSQQVESISRALRRSGASAGRDAGHAASALVDQAWHHGEVAAHELSRQAVRAGKAVKNDPLPTVVALAGFVLLLRLILGRRR